LTGWKARMSEQTAGNSNAAVCLQGRLGLQLGGDRVGSKNERANSRQLKLLQFVCRVDWACSWVVKK